MLQRFKFKPFWDACRLFWALVGRCGRWLVDFFSASDRWEVCYSFARVSSVRQQCLPCREVSLSAGYTFHCRDLCELEPTLLDSRFVHLQTLMSGLYQLPAEADIIAVASPRVSVRWCAESSAMTAAARTSRYRAGASNRVRNYSSSILSLEYSKPSDSSYDLHIVCSRVRFFLK